MGNNQQTLTPSETVVNDFLRAEFGLWIERDTNGQWHERLSLDYFDSPVEALKYTLEYALTIGVETL